MHVTLTNIEIVFRTFFLAQILEQFKLSYSLRKPM